MREMQGRNGRTFYVMSRHDLEHLPSFRSEAGGRKGRACCPIHDGDNPTALAIDWERGWANCYRCGAAIRVDEGRGAYTDATARAYAPVKRSTAPRRDEAHSPDQSHLYAALRAAVDRAKAALPSSSGAAYLVARGVALDVARMAGVGWGTTGKLAGRVIFPLTLPDGTATSAIGRAIDDQTRPKYRTLPSSRGYEKTLFNGAALGKARATGAPIVVVEGPFDALACIAGGVPLTVATCGTTYAHPEHFAGIPRALIAFDADTAGEEALRRWAVMLTCFGVVTDFLPVGALGDAKDLGEYWHRHGTIPDVITDYTTYAAYLDLPDDARRYADDLTASLIAGGQVAIEVLTDALPDPDALDYGATVYAIDQARQALRLDAARHCRSSSWE